MTHELLINGDKRIGLTSGTYIIGRNSDCTIQINDPTVSRYHATLTLKGNICRIIVGHYIKKNEVQNGLLINEKRLDPAQGAELQHLDQISLSRNTKIIYFNTVEPDVYDPDTTVSTQSED